MKHKIEYDSNGNELEGMGDVPSLKLYFAIRYNLHKGEDYVRKKFGKSPDFESILAEVREDMKNE